MLDIDRKTKLSLVYIPDLSKTECTEALRRIDDNAAIVSLGTIKAEAARSGLQIRAWAAGLMTPSQQAVEAEHALNHLNAEIACYDSHSAPSWGREPSLASAR